MERSAVSGRRVGPLPVIDPARGGALGAGAVLLAAAVAMINLRLEQSWAHGVHFTLTLAAFALVFGIALRSPLPERPLAYQATLALSALALLFFVLVRLAQVLGVHAPFNTGTLMWMSAVFAAVAGFAAFRFHSLASALFAGVAAAGFVLSFVDKVFDPNGVGTFRWVLFLLALVFAAAATYLRQGSRPEFAAQAVNVGGLTLIALGATFAATGLVGAFNPFAAGAGSGSVGFGWKAILVVGSLTLLAYAAVERERGPGYVGLVAFLLALQVVANPHGHATILGWPLVLLVLAIVAFAIGLAPRRRAHGAAPAGASRP